MERIEPVYNGRNSKDVVNVLNQVLETVKLPFKAIYEGEPEEYETVRYGKVRSYDYLPVYIVNEKGEKINASLSTRRLSGEDTSRFGVHNAYGTELWTLWLPNNVKVQFLVRIKAIDYMYSFKLVKLI